MCYLLIIGDFQTVCPWGTQLTDFLPTKSDFSWEQIHFSSPKPGPHTSEFLYCACKAQDQKPQGRDGPVPRTCSEGGASHILSVSILALCSLPEDAPDSPGDASGFSRGCRTFLASPAAIYSRSNLTRQMLAISPFCALHPMLRYGAGGEEADAKCGCVLTLLGPGLSVSQCFTETQIQLLLLDLSFPWRVKVVSLLPCLSSERILKHLQPD